MSQLSDYRRETAQLMSDARAMLQDALDLLSQHPQVDTAALLAVLTAFTTRLDRLETDANIRYDNFEEAEMVRGRLRKQRDAAYHGRQTLARWVTQLQAELAQYQAQYPKPTRPTPRAAPAIPPRPKKAPKKPIQQAFDFTEHPTDTPEE